MSWSYTLWCLRGAADALSDNEPNLAKRYIEKARETYECVICHGDITEGGDTQPYFKGVRHVDCANRWVNSYDFRKEINENE